MPSSEYYRRQADTLLSLAMTTSNPVLSNVCRNLAVEYKLLAERTGIGPAPDPCGGQPSPAREAEAEERQGFEGGWRRRNAR